MLCLHCSSLLINFFLFAAKAAEVAKAAADEQGKRRSAQAKVLADAEAAAEAASIAGVSTSSYFQ